MGRETMNHFPVIFKIIFAICLLQPLLIYAQSTYPKITVLHEGYVAPVEDRNFVPGKRSDGARLVASTVALVETADAIIVIDPGMVPGDIDLANKIESMGVSKEDVTHVFISHHHPDHTVRIGLFPNATVVDYWASYHNDLWQDHGDQFEIAPNVTVMRTPGHTDEDASLIVAAKDGTYVFTHVWWNENMQPEIDPLAEDQNSLVESRKKILEIADYIIPGHGKMFANPRQ